MKRTFRKLLVVSFNIMWADLSVILDIDLVTYFDRPLFYSSLVRKTSKQHMLTF